MTERDPREKRFKSLLRRRCAWPSACDEVATETSNGCLYYCPFHYREVQRNRAELIAQHERRRAIPPAAKEPVKTQEPAKTGQLKPLYSTKAGIQNTMPL